MSEIQRGEIWWADLPEPRRSEPGYRSPVLVVQADSFNVSRIQTTIVAANSAGLACDFDGERLPIVDSRLLAA